MPETAFPTSEPISGTSAQTFVGTLVGIIVLTAVLLLLDLFLARVDRRESEAHAAEEYSAGRALMASGRPADAEVRFGAAVAIDRRNVNYALALGEALLEQGRTADAEATLKELLDRAENDGAVNLAMAHVMAREGRLADTKAYYHRAIFGRWSDDSLAHRQRARLELIDLLARDGPASELLAELLPLEAISSDSAALRQRLGRLFLLAGAPRRATVVFQELLRRNPNDADARAGRGEASFSLGNFRAAHSDLTDALRIRPSDSRIAAGVAATDTALSLDPTVPGLPPRERSARSRTLLVRTLGAVGSCMHSGEMAILDSARAVLGAVPRPRSDEASSEAMTSLASSLWMARSPTCQPALRDSVLRLVHAHLVQ